MPTSLTVPTTFGAEENSFIDFPALMRWTRAKLKKEFKRELQNTSVEILCNKFFAN